jgi:hypothetical protein
MMVGGSLIDSGGTVQNLNSLIPNTSRYQISCATAINDSGQIVANATDNHTLLLTPADHPAQSAGPESRAGMADLPAASDSGIW